MSPVPTYFRLPLGSRDKTPNYLKSIVAITTVQPYPYEGLKGA